MKYIELFSGIGGLGYGLMQAGMECVGYCEIDKYAHKAFQILHDPEERMWNAYDVRSVTDDDIRTLGRERGQIQLIAAGFPCQAFSIAGKRKGFADSTRGTLFFEIIRFASILRPEFLLLENVDGLRNHDEGKTLGIILSTLDELGYDSEWQVLNSKNFGVPQNRERIFIVASLRGERSRKIFPFGGENSTAIEVVGRLEGKHDQNSRVYGTGGIDPTLSTMQGGGQEPKVLVSGQLDSDRGGTRKVYDPVGIAPTQLSQHGNAVKKITVNATKDAIGKQTDTANALLSRNYKGLCNQEMTVVMEPRAVLTPDRLEKRQNGRRMKDPGEPMFTLTAQDLHGVQQGYRIRKLTPLECFRLQSWPDEWYVKLKLFRKPELIELVDMSRNDITEQVLEILEEHGVKEGISDSQLYKMAGNGVTSIVAYEIGRRIMDNAA